MYRNVYDTFSLDEVQPQLCSVSALTQTTLTSPPLSIDLEINMLAYMVEDYYDRCR